VSIAIENDKMPTSLQVMDELIAADPQKEKRHESEWKTRCNGTGRSWVAMDDTEEIQPRPEKPAATNSTEDDLGYALVTGATRYRVRLPSSWQGGEIPLILVARDVDRLHSLAYDLGGFSMVSSVVFYRLAIQTRCS
jgi:hypothetical protein